jgi:hypothetical protein
VRATDVVEPDDGFDRFSLREVVAELALGTVGLLYQVVAFEPLVEEGAGGGGGSEVGGVAPGLNLFADFGYQRRQELFIRGAAQFFCGREPAEVGGAGQS